MKKKELLILLVEDNENHAELVKRRFEAHSIPNHLVHLSDGEEALNYLFRRDKYAMADYPPPNLILLDLRLPRVDGLSVLAEIKNSSLLQSIPTVVLTSSKSPSDLCTAYRSQVNSFLVKPTDFPDFSNLMDALIAYWLEWNTEPY